MSFILPVDMETETEISESNKNVLNKQGDTQHGRLWMHDLFGDWNWTINESTSLIYWHSIKKRKETYLGIWMHVEKLSMFYWDSSKLISYFKWIEKQFVCEIILTNVILLSNSMKNWHFA